MEFMNQPLEDNGYIPLGKGYFIIKLDNEEDKLHKVSGNWVVDEQEITLKNWEPNFNPTTQKTSLAYVWVNFPGLSIEYWKENIILQMGKALGRSIKVDETTLKKEEGFYASVLVVMDLSKAIPSKIWVESKYGGFEQTIQIPKLPKYCNHCKILGHYVAECKAKRQEQDKQEELKYSHPVKQIWRKVKANKKIAPAQVGFDICFTSPSKNKEVEIYESLLDTDEEVDEIIFSINAKKDTPQVNSGKFQLLQDMNEDIFHSQVEFPALSINEILKSASSAPSINEVINVIPPVEKEVVHEEVPKDKLKTTKNISIIKTRNQSIGLVNNGVPLVKMRGRNSSQQTSNK
ncbi:uncharacterized protein LOC113359831 [Papaver somniferum]|uniref:uncharacterized protein LOC113359831 n=1 Tax=Papaver somniferum TaxID=3469 RepID=UPI000E6FEC5D|nr:uncharacterized protein LOC113359831 [Papaver somniferum]